MLIFLTDGLATVGETNKDSILTDTTNKNEQKYSIHTVAFGDDADYPLLQRLSSKNRGVARKIYEDSDSDLQLEGMQENQLFIVERK